MSLGSITATASILQLNQGEEIDLDYLKRQFRKFAKVYHPDTADEQYRDGEMFKKLKVAFDFASNNIDEINDYLMQKTYTNTFSSQRKAAKGRYYAERVGDSRPYNIEKCLWETVDSSSLEYIYYDADRKYFFVLFRTNRSAVYCYVDVDYEEYNKYLKAASKGSYINRQIKPKYKCLRFDYYRNNDWKPSLFTRRWSLLTTIKREVI